MSIGQQVYTPRFCTVRIMDIFDSEAEARQAGWTEQTYYEDPEWIILGRTIDMYHMDFAAAHK